MNFWQKRIVDPLKAQLTQGVAPAKIALSCALGLTLGVFPILGSTTLLCFIAALCLKLNQPAIQAVNYLVYPLQIGLLPAFVRIGEKIFNAEPVSFSPVQLTREFGEGPGAFLAKYGIVGLHGITAWILIAPLIAAGLYFPLFFTFKKMSQGYRRK